MKHFAIKVIIIIFLLFLALFFCAYSIIDHNNILAIISFLGSLFFSFQLYLLNTSQNKKLVRLFESIKYQDFNILFKKDNHWGESFKDLNNQLNEVVKSFNKERSDREASFHFIQAIVKQLTVGVLVLNSENKIELSNAVASKILGLYRITYLSDIEKSNAEFAKLLTDLKNGENKVFRIQNMEISVYMSELVLRGRKIRLFSFQDIHLELQNRELEAWQNLTKVLRHEIMNSLTPIISLTQTAEEIVKHELDVTKSEAYNDLLASMLTIKNRSKGLLDFVNAYREFTKLPEPEFENFNISELTEPILLLFHDEKIKLNIVLNSDFEINADKNLLTQVLINLVKNAKEAVLEADNPEVELVFEKYQKEVFISVKDNGTGISKEHAEQIFVPFYSTKSNGSGVGLSLSRQIIQNHGGVLSFQKNPIGGSIFRIEMKS